MKPLRGSLLPLSFTPVLIAYCPPMNSRIMLKSAVIAM